MSFRRLTLSCLALLLIVSIPVFSHAEEKNSRTKAQKELQRIQEQLKGVKKKEKEAVRRERSVLTDLERIDQSLARKRSEVKKLEGRLDAVGREMDATGREMADYRAKANAKEGELAGRLRAMYKADKAGGPWVLLVSGDYGSMLKRYKYLAVMSERDKRMMDGYRDDMDELARYNERLKGQKEDYDRLKKARDAEAAKVLAQEDEKKDMLASIRKQKGLYETMARELEESGQRMRELLKRLEQEKKTLARPSVPALDIPAPTGRLDWPVKGKVISLFGRQKHPEYDTYIYKNGIEIQAPMGTEVHAIDGAVVAFANWFKGLGLVAILRHGGDLYSVYAHLAELKVKPGDRVARGQAIATLGDTGAPSGPSLYFEIRKGAEAQDPMKWLRR